MIAVALGVHIADSHESRCNSAGLETVTREDRQEGRSFSCCRSGPCRLQAREKRIPYEDSRHELVCANATAWRQQILWRLLVRFHRDVRLRSVLALILRGSHRDVHRAVWRRCPRRATRCGRRRSCLRPQPVHALPGIRIPANGGWLVLCDLVSVYSFSGWRKMSSTVAEVRVCCNQSPS